MPKREKWGHLSEGVPIFPSFDKPFQRAVSFCRIRFFIKAEHKSMSKTFDQGKDEVAKLCRYFETNHKAFLGPAVKEAHIRQLLIDSMLALHK